jgi:succinyl-CoA synthetase beta subunit
MAQLTEHLSKQLLARYGVPFGAYDLVSTAQEAAGTAERVAAPVMVKAQAPVGGRGKAGGVLKADTPSEASQAFESVTAVDLDGLQAETAIVERWIPVQTEFYLGVVVDPRLSGPALLFSAQGGVEVEGVAGELHSVPMRLDGTVDVAAFRRGAYAEVQDARTFGQLVRIAQAFARAYRSLDAQLVEINPLALLPDGGLLALDARLIVDDNALFRQPEVSRLISKMRPRRIEEQVKDETRLDYVRLEGELGLISGGAGLTMAAMDLIADAGSTPACFLDCSANPTKDGYGRALDLLLSDEKVKAILISIFGGLTHVDRVASTLVALLEQRPGAKPITIRLMGTNVDGAEQILSESGLINHPELEQAVAAAVSCVTELRAPEILS